METYKLYLRIKHLNATRLDALDLDKSCLNTDLKKSCWEKNIYETMKQLGQCEHWLDMWRY